VVRFASCCKLFALSLGEMDCVGMSWCLIYQYPCFVILLLCLDNEHQSCLSYIVPRIWHHVSGWCFKIFFILPLPCHDFCWMLLLWFRAIIQTIHIPVSNFMTRGCEALSLLGCFSASCFPHAIITVLKTGMH
jgi:hypothetical protein